MAAVGADIHVITRLSDAYPERLRRIHDPPPVLYVRGELGVDGPAVAVVGARRASPTGRLAAERIAGDLAACGVTIVSGLARGIDGVAHRAALEAGGRTVAVLGCGLDVVYPAEHAPLAEAITARGCLLTEFPPGTPPLPGHFPQRNRIIAGLTLGVVVVEGDERSGALITAACALEEGREVMAVPGSILNPMSRAPHRLLREGATLVEHAGDVLAALNLVAVPPLPAASDPELSDPASRAVWAALAGDPVHIDAVAEETGLGAARVGAILVDLEVRGLVRQLAGKQFIRAYTAGREGPRPQHGQDARRR